MEIARILQTTSSSVEMVFENKAVNPRNIFSLLSLAIPPEAVVKVTVEGSDAQIVMQKLLAILNRKYL